MFAGIYEKLLHYYSVARSVRFDVLGQIIIKFILSLERFLKVTYLRK